MKESMDKSIVFKIHEKDNVATALTNIKIGEAHINGDHSLKVVEAREEIDMGHKLSIKDIEAGEHIIKYGVIIGMATEFIKKGSWVHLHNCKSLYDERSSTLDLRTGVSTDIDYKSEYTQ